MQPDEGDDDSHPSASEKEDEQDFKLLPLHDQSKANVSGTERFDSARSS